MFLYFILIPFDMKYYFDLDFIFDPKKVKRYLSKKG